MGEKKKYIDCSFLTSSEDDYITLIFLNCICVYKNGIWIFQKNETNINGAIYDGNTLYYTKNDDNTIYINELDNSTQKCILLEYKKVKLQKCIHRANKLFVIEFDNIGNGVYDLA